ncbi:hypothetical protein FB451DRAFT_1166634 [Mycena latifolia]|nr:hypothetical protein FB451DRAFT_1166634 [Mycena latifolia]
MPADPNLRRLIRTGRRMVLGGAKLEKSAQRVLETADDQLASTCEYWFQDRKVRRLFKFHLSNSLGKDCGFMSAPPSGYVHANAMRLDIFHPTRRKVSAPCPLPKPLLQAQPSLPETRECCVSFLRLLYPLESLHLNLRWNPSSIVVSPPAVPRAAMKRQVLMIHAPTSSGPKTSWLQNLPLCRSSFRMSTIYISQSIEPRFRLRPSKSGGIKFKQYIPPDERDPPRFFERLGEKMFGTSEKRMRRKKERQAMSMRRKRFAQQTEEYYAVLGPERQLGDSFTQGASRAWRYSTIRCGSSESPHTRDFRSTLHLNSFVSVLPHPWPFCERPKRKHCTFPLSVQLEQAQT